MSRHSHDHRRREPVSTVKDWEPRNNNRQSIWMYSKVHRCTLRIYIHSVYICNIKRHTKNNNAIEAQTSWLKTGSNFVALFLDTMMMKIPLCIVDQPPGFNSLEEGILEIIQKQEKSAWKNKISCARGQIVIFWGGDHSPRLLETNPIIPILWNYNSK